MIHWANLSEHLRERTEACLGNGWVILVGFGQKYHLPTSSHTLCDVNKIGKDAWYQGGSEYKRVKGWWVKKKNILKKWGFLRPSVASKERRLWSWDMTGQRRARESVWFSPTLSPVASKGLSRTEDPCLSEALDCTALTCWLSYETQHLARSPKRHREWGFTHQEEASYFQGLIRKTQEAQATTVLEKKFYHPSLVPFMPIFPPCKSDCLLWTIQKPVCWLGHNLSGRSHEQCVQDTEFDPWDYVFSPCSWVWYWLTMSVISQINELSG